MHKHRLAAEEAHQRHTTELLVMTEKHALDWQAQEELNEELSASLAEVTDHINVQAETVQHTIQEARTPIQTRADPWCRPSPRLCMS